MSILNARRISQAFFLALFIWFCYVSVLGESWFQLRGWPVNWFLQLDPLVALVLVLATGTLFAGMAWALVTVGLTVILGRFFCGWVCPLGAINHFVGWLSLRRKTAKQRAAGNKYHPAQALKYYVLLFFLAAAAGDLAGRLSKGAYAGPAWSWGLALLGAAALAGLAVYEIAGSSRKRLWAVLLALVLWLGLGHVLAGGVVSTSSMLSGLLDPLPLLQRSVNLLLWPLADPAGRGPSLAERLYLGDWLIAAVFLAVLGLNLLRPRFFCRFVCPLGALFGLVSRFAVFRMGKEEEPCRACGLCETRCQGACAPSTEHRLSECLLCANCRQICPDSVISFDPAPSAAGERLSPDLTRRGVLWSLFGGTLAVPVLRLGGLVKEARWPVRPPGALAEPDFLARCTNCGQCMRICPTGVIQPAGLDQGLESLWTPVLNFKLSKGGCLINCVACGHLCPTAAIKPLSLAERQGKSDFSADGPIRLGAAFVDRGRCLPWAMDRPCIVCQEMCPVSPKAIFTRTEYRTLRSSALPVTQAEKDALALGGAGFKPGELATGDYFAWSPEFQRRRRIIANTTDGLTLAPEEAWPRALEPGKSVEVQVRLLLPFVDPSACVGCGACEQACPLKLRSAIRVSGENQTRSRTSFLLKAGGK